MSVAPESNELPVYSVGGDRYTFLLTGEQTGGGCFVFEAYVPPGKGSPPHVHRREDEGFYVIEGEFEIHVAGEPIRLGPGDFLFGKRGVPHNFTNIGTTPGKMIITVTPAGLESYFAQVGTRLKSRDEAPIEPTHDDIQKLFALAPEYGVELIH